MVALSSWLSALSPFLLRTFQQGPSPREAEAWQSTASNGHRYEIGLPFLTVLADILFGIWAKIEGGSPTDKAFEKRAIKGISGFIEEGSKRHMMG